MFDELYKEGVENFVFYLVDVLYIDVVIFGYLYCLFLNKEFVKLLNVDIVNGIVKGILESMVGYWVNNISVVDLGLIEYKGKWIVILGKVVFCLIYDVEIKKVFVKNDLEIIVFLVLVYEVICKFVF